MAAVLKTVLTFGMVAIPVRIHAATGDDSSPTTHLLHKPCGTRISQRFYCVAEACFVDRSDTGAGVEVGRDRHITLTEDEIAGLPVPSREAVELTQFVAVDEAHSLVRFASKTYYVEPMPAGRSAYALLRGALDANRLVAFGTVTLRQREQLIALQASGPVLLLQTLSWPDDIREAGSLDLPDVALIATRGSKLADQLVRAMKGRLDVSAFRNQYRDAFNALVAAKVNGQQVPTTTPRTVASIPDLMAALEASVAAARAKRPRGKTRRLPTVAA